MNTRILALSVVGATLIAATVVRAEQENMQEAMRHLRAARASLEAARANKGGHRNKAIDLVEQAMEQVKRGMESRDDQKKD